MHPTSGFIFLKVKLSCFLRFLGLLNALLTAVLQIIAGRRGILL
jgi:hypothetical protein